MTARRAYRPELSWSSTSRTVTKLFRLAVDTVALLTGAALSGIGLQRGLILSATTAAGLGVLDQYRDRLALSRQVGAIVCVAVPVVALYAGWTGRRDAGEARLVLGMVTVAAAGRVLANLVLTALRRRGRWLHGSILVGTGPLAVSLARDMRAHPEYGLLPVGFVDDDIDPDPDPDPDLPVLGRVRDLPDLVGRLRIENVVVAFGRLPDRELVSALRSLRDRHVTVYTVPRLFELTVSRHGIGSDNIRGIPLQLLNRSSSHRLSSMAKRAVDVAVAGAGLVVFGPLGAVSAVLVKLSSPGPVFFRQLRLGRHGHPFWLIKFRSMRENDDGDTKWSVGGDDRVTAIGKWLRRSNFDEVPQLWNVLRGEMSLVGPRPERPFFVSRFAESDPRYPDRLRVLPGITGWAQVNGLRGDTPIVERSRLDNHYIENWSFWNDFSIIGLTVRTVGQDLFRPAQRRSAGVASAGSAVRAPHVLVDLPLLEEVVAAEA